MVITKTQAATGGGLAVLGAGGTAAGTVLVNGKEDLDKVEFKPSFTVLALDTDFISSYPSSDSSKKIGYSYGWYLVSASNSEDWWKESYRKWSMSSKLDLSNEFKDSSKITSGYSSGTSGDDSSKALNKVCKAIYSKTSDQVDLVDSSGNAEKNKLGKDVLNYCSPLGQIPKTVNDLKESDSKYKDSTYGKIYENDLVSINSLDNKTFWWLRHQEFVGKDKENGTGASVQSSDALLHKFYQDRKITQETIRVVCGKIYSETNGYNSSEIKKFCSWKSAFSL